MSDKFSKTIIENKDSNATYLENGGTIRETIAIP